MAVSLLLDTSGSMSGTSCILGALAYACKTACDSLKIPCTVSTFETRGWLVWAPEDKPTHIQLPALGGTNIIGCCEVLGEQQYDKSNHLVLVMTDGQFNKDFRGFQHYGADGRYFIGLGYGWNVAESLKEQNPHEVYGIRDLMQIPQVLQGFLIEYLR